MVETYVHDNHVHKFTPTSFIPPSRVVVLSEQIGSYIVAQEDWDKQPQIVVVDADVAGCSRGTEIDEENVDLTVLTQSVIRIGNDEGTPT